MDRIVFILFIYQFPSSYSFFLGGCVWVGGCGGGGVTYV